MRRDFPAKIKRAAFERCKDANGIPRCEDCTAALESATESKSPSRIMCATARAVCARQSSRFAGTKTEQIKQIGNAVSVRMMKACVLALMADAAPTAKAATVEPDEAVA
jgi:site-specific DNA-cytosine methylase